MEEANNNEIKLEIDQEHLKKVFSCRRRVFSIAEDQRLAEIVASKKYTNWIEIANHLPGRTPRQCRDRWLNYLSPENSFKPWTEDEDRLIVQCVNEIGTKWSKIAKQIPGRSDNSIKNRWYSFLKNKCTVISQGKRVLKPFHLKQKEKEPIEQKSSSCLYYCPFVQYPPIPCQNYFKSEPVLQTENFEVFSMPPKEEENDDNQKFEKIILNQINEIDQYPFNLPEIFNDWTL